MRIALLTGHLSHKGFGVRNAVEVLSESLMGLGHEVRVFGLSDPAWETSEHTTWRGAPTEALPFLGPEKFGYTPGLAKALTRFRPDIIHVNGLWMHTSVVGPKVAKKIGAKLVVSPHGMMAEAALKYSNLQKRVALSLFQRACLKASDGLHATAVTEREEIQTLVPGSKIAVIPNGLRTTAHVGKAMESRKNRVIAIGRLHHKKGYDLLLRAWKSVEDRFPDWTLEIRGPSADDYANQLEHLSADLGLTHAVLGASVNEAERDRLLGTSKLFVLSSHNENFALTVPEALFQGTPVLASKGTPWAGLETQGCGWWVDMDPESLAAGLISALSVEDPVRAQMGQKGREWVQRAFSAENAARSMIEFYDSLAPGRSS